MAFLQDKTKNIKMPKMPAMPGAKKTSPSVEGGKTPREESKVKESASFSKQSSGIAASFVSNVTPR